MVFIRGGMNEIPIALQVALHLVAKAVGHKMEKFGEYEPLIMRKGFAAV